MLYVYNIFKKNIIIILLLNILYIKKIYQKIYNNIYFI